MPGSSLETHIGVQKDDFIPICMLMGPSASTKQISLQRCKDSKGGGDWDDGREAEGGG